MRAAVYSKAKSGKVLEINDLEQPVPKNNEVLIRVRAASVNPLDWRLKSQRPGVDVAGEVVAVGGMVTQFMPGESVFGTCKGAFAEYACASQSTLVSKPESMSFDQAAALPIAVEAAKYAASRRFCGNCEFSHAIIPPYAGRDPLGSRLGT